MRGWFKKVVVAGLLIVMAVPVLPMKTEAAPYVSQNNNRVEWNFNTDWLFFNSNVPNGQAPDLDESGAAQVNLPHSNSDIELFDVTPPEWQTVNWYRRHFSIADTYAGRRVSVEFQGAGQINKVYVNGKLAGEGRGIHTSFTVDITDYIKFGNFDNVIAVQVDNQPHANTMPYQGDFYSFGGIHGDVKLHMTDPVYAALPYYVTTPNSGGGVNVTGSVNIRNENPSSRDAVVKASLVDATGEVVAVSEQTVTVGARAETRFDFVQQVANPHLWTIDDPYLYKMKVQTRIGSSYVDELSTNIGLKWVAITGDSTNKTSKFFLNGVETKLIGYNKHNQQPYLGNSGPNRLQRKDARMLKFELGANVVRTSHYTTDPEFLDEADKIGLLVEEEAFGMNTLNDVQKPLFEQSLSSMVYRDRNHASIFMWSVVPNETLTIGPWHAQLNAMVKSIDPSRPTVQEMVHGDYEQIADVYSSHNYAPPGQAVSPKKFPHWIGEYNNSLGSSFVVPGDSEGRKLKQLLDDASKFQTFYSSPQIAGLLHWESFGYITPLVNDQFGKSVNEYRAAGVTGPYRDALNKYWLGYFYQSQMDRSVVGDVLHIASEWKKDSNKKEFYVISNAATVELFHNGTSLGKIAPNYVTSSKQGMFKFTLSQDLVWSPSSILEARSYDANDNLLKTDKRFASTYDGAASLKLNATTGNEIAADGSDVAWLIPELLDANGQRAYYGDANVRIKELSGPGESVFTSSSRSETLQMTDGLTGFYVQSKLRQTGAVKVKVEADLGATVNDSVYGAGAGQFTFAGSGWTVQTGQTGRFNGDEHVVSTGVAGDTYAEMTFTGTQIRVYGTKARNMGIATVEINDQAAGSIDFFSNYGEVPSQLVYTSPEMAYGTHKIRISYTGQMHSRPDLNEQAATGAGINIDRVKIMDGQYELVSNEIALNAVPMSDTVVPKPAAGAPKAEVFSASVVFQAEQAARATGAVVASAETGFNGTGYVDMKNTQGYVEWTVPVTQSGRYPLQFRYKNTGVDRKADLSVNGSVVAAKLSFMETGTAGAGDSPWGVVTTTQYLKAGINKIRLAATGSSVTHMDQLEVLGLPQPPSAPSPQQVVLQAENGTFNTSASVKNLGSGWTGSGFVNFNNAPGYVQWNTTIPAAGDYLIDIAYAYGSAGSTTAKLIIDGAAVTPDISFPSTGSWNAAWGKAQVTVPLTAGAHTIKLETVGSYYVNLDSITATEVTVPPTPELFDAALQAETAARSVGTVGSLGTGWNGTGFINFSGGEGYVEWTADVPESNYTLRFRYANGSSNRPMKLLIDGKEASGSLAFPGTGHWNQNWSEVTFTADLSKGAHKIRLVTTGTSGVNLDQLRIKEN
ncbi:carbohydrate-binding protein [Paenibacillus pasadenensis]|uniref:carbohydrate-binding protein n=1 Tax=Paenibacillus pasadenensis TaxID=217090 RepID=UPI002040806D|nr:carbohydrate-binding protein [Paenibacillus pasadenensis]MCM3747219.1 carbohydrate-binding protein [Paenibacillus pasadenensis]